MLPQQYLFKRRRRQLSVNGCAILKTAMISTAIVAFTPSTAFAKYPAPHVEMVRHDDLNLASAKDIGRLERRIGRAAKSLCSRPGIAAHILRRQINDCIDATKAGALRDLEQKTSILTAAIQPQN